MAQCFGARITASLALAGCNWMELEAARPQGEKMGFQLHDVEWPLLALALLKPEQAAADQQFITEHAPDPALKKYTVAVAHSQT